MPPAIPALVLTNIIHIPHLCFTVKIGQNRAVVGLKIETLGSLAYCWQVMQLIENVKIFLWTKE